MSFLNSDFHRLENRGLVGAEWKETESGREAKFYSLTRKGKIQLQKETAGWLRLADLVGLILRLEKGAVDEPA